MWKIGVETKHLGSFSELRTGLGFFRLFVPSVARLFPSLKHLRA